MRMNPTQKDGEHLYIVIYKRCDLHNILLRYYFVFVSQNLNLGRMNYHMLHSSFDLVSLS